MTFAEFFCQATGYEPYPWQERLAAAEDWPLGQRHPFPWFAFWRQRAGGRGCRAGDRGYWLRLEFPEQVLGAIALGYGAHFGLGLFRPLGSD